MERRQARGGTLVVGGGFAGAYVARLLRKRGATIVNPDNFMLYTPLLPEAAAATLEPRHVVVAKPLARELDRSLEGISPRTLSLRLRALEEQGIVERHTYPEVPPRVEYSLTVKGEALVPLIEDMRSYGREWLGVDEDSCATTRGRPAVAAA